MDTRWTLVLAAPVLLVFMAWISWLLFNLIIAKWHGLEGLKATPAVAQAFHPRDWAVPTPRFRQHPAVSEHGTPVNASDTPGAQAEDGCV